VWSADDNDLDRAIDTVARRMTAGEPSADLRARVVDRLGERDATRRWIWIAVPVAAAATIVIALFVARDRHTPAVTPLATVAADRTAPPSTTAAAPTVADAHVATPDRATARTTQRPTRLSTQPLHAPPSEVATLAPDVLSVTSIQLTAIEPAESIRLPRLETIEPIAVPPIGEPQGDRP
jgi:hypothetical protein